MTRLHDDRKRRVQVPRDYAQIANQLVGLFAHDSAPGEVLDDAVEQARIAQQRQRLGPLVIGQLDFRLLRRKRLLDLLVRISSSFISTWPRSRRIISSLMPSSSAACL